MTIYFRKENRFQNIYFTPGSKFERKVASLLDTVKKFDETRENRENELDGHIKKLAKQVASIEQRESIGPLPSHPFVLPRTQAHVPLPPGGFNSSPLALSQDVPRHTQEKLPCPPANVIQHTDQVMTYPLQEANQVPPQTGPVTARPDNMANVTQGGQGPSRPQVAQYNTEPGPPQAWYGPRHDGASSSRDAGPGHHVQHVPHAQDYQAAPAPPGEGGDQCKKKRRRKRKRGGQQIDNTQPLHAGNGAVNPQVHQQPQNG